MDHKIYSTLNLHSSQIQSPIILHVAIIRSGAAALVRGPLEPEPAAGNTTNLDFIHQGLSTQFPREEENSIYIYYHVGRWDELGPKGGQKLYYNVGVTHRLAWNLPILPLGNLRLLAPWRSHRLCGASTIMRDFNVVARRTWFEWVIRSWHLKDASRI